MTPLRLPPPFGDVVAEFDRFWPRWRGRPARHSKPIWCLTAGAATVRAWLPARRGGGAAAASSAVVGMSSAPKGAPPLSVRFDVLASMTQAFVLLAFNRKPAWRVGELADELGTPLDALYGELRALLAPAHPLLLADTNFWRTPGQCHALFLHACPVGGAMFSVGSR